MGPAPREVGEKHEDWEWFSQEDFEEEYKSKARSENSHDDMRLLAAEMLQVASIGAVGSKARE
jgi:hypothetical protein